MPKKLKLGMVGGGQDAFIGNVHRMAARLDGHWEFVAGALSSTPERALASGIELGLDKDRIYTDFDSMARSEAARDDRIDAVSIVTPNHAHFGPAKAFLERGIPVICDKPLTTTLEDANTLATLVEQTKTPLILTHNYTAYPMIRHAREMVEAGELGDLRIIHIEYIQDWLAEPIESFGQKQASWRTDPVKSGAGGAIGDIGTHAYNLARFVAQKKANRLSAHLHSFIPGRVLDDNAHIIIDFEEQLRGVLLASQVMPGYENEIRLRISGSQGSIEWHQSSANQLLFAKLGEAPRIVRRAGAGAGIMANAVSRIPGGHPEGYLEAFATIYTEVAGLIRGEDQPLLPDIRAGIEGLEFISNCVDSAHQDGAWVKF